jgi:hypothetical protein
MEPLYGKNVQDSTHHFVSFGTGDGGYRSALQRLKKEIKRLDSEAKVWLFDENNVDEDICGLSVKLSIFAKKYPRGYGLWVWKPWIIWQVLNNAQEGDVVFYLDAGCTVHTSAASISRYHDYLTYIKQQGMLHFHQKYLLRSWSKRAVLEHFNIDVSELDTGQTLGGIQGYLVNESSRHFVKAWLLACTLDNGRLLQDVENNALEDSQFIEHRHDQSVLSCLIKQQNKVTIPDETFFFPNWNLKGDGFPFWATRKHSRLTHRMGYYAPRQWPFVLAKKLTRKPIIENPDITAGI